MRVVNNILTFLCLVWPCFSLLMSWLLPHSQHWRRTCQQYLQELRQSWHFSPLWSIIAPQLSLYHHVGQKEQSLLLAALQPVVKGLSSGWGSRSLLVHFLLPQAPRLQPVHFGQPLHRQFRGAVLLHLKMRIHLKLNLDPVHGVSSHQHSIIIQNDFHGATFNALRVLGSRCHRRFVARLIQRQLKWCWSVQSIRLTLNQRNWGWGNYQLRLSSCLQK